MAQPTFKEKELIKLVQKRLAYVDSSQSVEKDILRQAYFSVYTQPEELMGENEFLGSIRKKFVPFKRALNNVINKPEPALTQREQPVLNLEIGEIYQVIIWSPYGSKAVLQGELESFEIRKNAEKAKRIEELVLKDGVHVLSRFSPGVYFEKRKFHPWSDYDVQKITNKELFFRMRDTARIGECLI